MTIQPQHRRFTTSADGPIEIAALDWGGHGPIALLHHANGLCAATWILVAEALVRDYRVVAIGPRDAGVRSVRHLPWKHRQFDVGASYRACGYTSPTLFARHYSPTLH